MRATREQLVVTVDLASSSASTACMAPLPSPDLPARMVDLCDLHERSASLIGLPPRFSLMPVSLMPDEATTAVKHVFRVRRRSGTRRLEFLR